MPIHRKEYTEDTNIILIDTMQFDLQEITTAFCYYDGQTALLMDVGTSDNVKTVLETLPSKGVPLEKLSGIVLTHYHFDHGGGTSTLWNIMKDKNPGFRIFTTSTTKNLLNNAGAHLTGAQTTFGPFVGTMEPLPDEAFVLVEPDGYLPVEFETGAKIKLVHTPGHTPDHCSPCVFQGKEAVFLFAGEACGTHYNPSKIITGSTSMPPNFDFDTYMQSVEKMSLLYPQAVGFGHFGVISGEEDTKTLFKEHTGFMRTFRDEVYKAFKEKPSTGHVLEATAPLWEERLNPEHINAPGSDLFYGNLKLAVTYGMLVSLGLRESRYEPRQEA